MNPTDIIIVLSSILLGWGAVLRLYRGWQEMKEERERGPWIYRRYDGQ